MYGLKQAAQLAYDALLINLKKYGHAPDKYSPNMWVHETCTTKCCLCVDNCGAKYTSRVGTQYLINTLQENYYITVDWSGQAFYGLDLKWNHAQGYADIIMQNFFIKIQKVC